jgi:hypothetical protein
MTLNVNIANVLQKYQSQGTESCFHGRHINPQIYAGLDGNNWSIKDYEARGGYQALRKILGLDGGPGMTQEAVRSVGFEAGDLDAMMKQYNPDQLRDGYNKLPNGEELFYISNPALGLWGLKSQFA